MKERAQVSNFDLVILGGGSGGYAAALRGAQLGLSVALVEADKLGGTCLHRGCIPTKALLHAGEIADGTRDASHFGINATFNSIDMTGVNSYKDGVVAKLHKGLQGLVKSRSITYIEGHGKLVAKDTVEVNGARYTGKNIVLATGSYARTLPGLEIDGKRVITSEHAIKMDYVPKSVIVLGGGVIGCEFASVWKSFGAEVTIIEGLSHLVALEDESSSKQLERAYRKRGINFELGVRFKSHTVTADGVTIECTDGRVVTGSHALLAIGSIPNTDNLGLSDVGVELIDGYVKINHNCQSSLQHVYAAGDVSGKLPLSSVAALQGRKIAEHAMGLHVGPHRHIDYEKAASAIFTEPEIADVGLAEADAFAMGRKIRVTKVPFSANAKALIEDDSRGFVKIVSDPATGVVLGGSIVGRHAAELIAVLALAVSAGLRVNDLHESLFVHPSMAEALSDAAE